jgi:hypothetical protein
MKNQKSLIFVGILAMAGIATASQGDVAKKLQSIYSKMDSLALKKDISGLTKLLNQVSTSDCVFVSKGFGKNPPMSKSRDETMKQMSVVIPMIDAVTTSTSHVDKVTMGNGSLIASLHQTVAMITKATQQTGPAHKIVQKTTSEDTWVKSGGSWKLKVSRIVTETIIQDGKEMKM